MRDHFKLTQNEIKVTKIVNPDNTDHYYQFSGGGDIYIENLKELLVIYSGPELSKHGTLTPGGDTESASIKGEKGDYTHQSLRDQLLASSILACTSAFLKKCQMEYDSAFIKDVTQISRYSVAYTGMGSVGFYKLSIKFDELMEFEARIPLEQRHQPDAAAVVDFAIDCFTRKVAQDNSS